MEVFSDLVQYDRGGLSEESRVLDFNDVFGGPPRRFSMQEARVKYSFGERVGPEEDGGSSSWGPMKEKAVFREERVVRRRHQNDDFYDDIFRGDERYGTPRSRGRDLDGDNLFGSSPGSTIMSHQTRLLSPMNEPYGASLPAEFRFSNQASRDQDDIRNDDQQAYHQSPLSHEASSSREDSQYNVQNTKKDTKNVDSNKFHFSIYKWAGRGVPMITPRLSRNSWRSKDNRRFDSSSSNATMEIIPSTESLKIECKNKDSKGEENIKELDDQYCIEQAVFDVLDSKSRNDAKENVAFEVNHLPTFLSNEVDQTGNVTEMKENETITPKEAISDTKISVGNSDDPYEDNFLVQELSEDLEEVIEIGEASEDIKDLDAKIRQWSSGKKGNIRSLLSTLQYVLWEGSGWRPIALVDLIETNSVKKAYQKALLRLHPDKLQQKSAASHQKYIAEKVFDILQEAWDHFNTLVPL